MRLIVLLFFFYGCRSYFSRTKWFEAERKMEYNWIWFEAARGLRFMRRDLDPLWRPRMGACTLLEAKDGEAETSGGLVDMACPNRDNVCKCVLCHMAVFGENRADQRNARGHRAKKKWPPRTDNNWRLHQRHRIIHIRVTMISVERISKFWVWIWVGALEWSYNCVMVIFRYSCYDSSAEGSS